VSKADAKHHFALAQRALAAADDAQRDAALGEGFARFGMGFAYSLGELARLENTPGPYTALSEESGAFLLRWIGGARLTKRADDDERRVAVGEEMLLMAQGHVRIGGIVARAILSLPASHPQRDLQRAETLVRQRLGAALNDDDPSSFVASVSDLLDHGLAAGDEAVLLYEQARQRLPIEGEPQLRRRLNVAPLKFHAKLAIEARDAGEASRLKEQSALARQRADAIGARLDMSRLIVQINERFETTMVVAEHDARAALEICDRLVVLDHGHNVAEGTPFDLTGAVETAYRAEVSGLDGDDVAAQEPAPRQRLDRPLAELPGARPDAHPASAVGGPQVDLLGMRKSAFLEPSLANLVAGISAVEEAQRRGRRSQVGREHAVPRQFGAMVLSVRIDTVSKNHR